MAGTKPRIEVHGVRELNRALAKSAEHAQDLKRVHQQLGAPLVAIARLEAPTRSGALAGSIRVSASKRALGLRAGGARVPYANPIHWGWPRRGIAPNEFLIRARDAAVPQVLDGYEKQVNELLDTVTRESK